MTRAYRVHHWQLDAAAGTIMHDQSGELRRLGEYQFRLLYVLAEHAGKPMTREELHELVWGNRVVGNNSLPNAIHALRHALEDDGRRQKIIKTIPRKGYLLDEKYCQSINVKTEVASHNDADKLIDMTTYLSQTHAIHATPHPTMNSDCLMMENNNSDMWKGLCLIQFFLCAVVVAALI